MPVGTALQEVTAVSQTMTSEPGLFPYFVAFGSMFIIWGLLKWYSKKEDKREEIRYARANAREAREYLREDALLEQLDKVTKTNQELVTQLNVNNEIKDDIKEIKSFIVSSASSKGCERGVSN